MNEWRQTITVLCTVVLAVAALAALILSEHATLRTEMQFEHAGLRTEMQLEHAALRAEHEGIRNQLNSVDRRTARIEGHLFGIEIAPEQLDGE